MLLGFCQVSHYILMKPCGEQCQVVLLNSLCAPKNQCLFPVVQCDHLTWVFMPLYKTCNGQNVFYERTIWALQFELRVNHTELHRQTWERWERWVEYPSYARQSSRVSIHLVPCSQQFWWSFGNGCTAQIPHVLQQRHDFVHPFLLHHEFNLSKKHQMLEPGNLGNHQSAGCSRNHSILVCDCFLSNIMRVSLTLATVQQQ